MPPTPSRLRPTTLPGGNPSYLSLDGKSPSVPATPRTLSRSPPRPPSAPDTDVRGLRVLTPMEGGGFQQMDPDKGLFKCVASVISLALDILDSTPSKYTLKDITQNIILANKASPAVQKIKDNDNRSLVSTYIRKVRASLPHIVVSEEYGMQTKNGRTTKRDCPGGFDPKQAAVIELSKTLLQQLHDAHEAKNTERFSCLHVRLSLTMAHELVHVYTLFLLRDRRNHTPPLVSFGHQVTDETGEAGRYWESKLLGGYVDMRVTDDGVETVALVSSQGHKYWRLTPAVIKGILERDFQHWLHPDGGQLIDGELAKGLYTEILKPMQWVRYRDFFDGKSVTAPAEMTSGQIAELTGPEIMRRPQYTISGDEMRKFVLDQRRR